MYWRWPVCNVLWMFPPAERSSRTWKRGKLTWSMSWGVFSTNQVCLAFSCEDKFNTKTHTLPVHQKNRLDSSRITLKKNLEQKNDRICNHQWSNPVVLPCTAQGYNTLINTGLSKLNVIIIISFLRERLDGGGQESGAGADGRAGYHHRTAQPNRQHHGPGQAEVSSVSTVWWSVILCNYQQSNSDSVTGKKRRINLWKPCWRRKVSSVINITCQCGISGVFLPFSILTFCLIRLP